MTKVRDTTPRAYGVQLPRAHCVVGEDIVTYHVTAAELKRLLDECDAFLRGLQPLPSPMNRLAVKGNG